MQTRHSPRVCSKVAQQCAVLRPLLVLAAVTGTEGCSPAPCAVLVGVIRRTVPCVYGAVACATEEERGARSCDARHAYKKIHYSVSRCGTLHISPLCVQFTWQAFVVNISNNSCIVSLSLSMHANSVCLQRAFFSLSFPLSRSLSCLRTHTLVRSRICGNMLIYLCDPSGSHII